MNANAGLLSLIGDIYDTTFDQASWNNTLKRIAECAGAQSGGLVAKSATGEVRIAQHVGVSPHFVQTYLDKLVNWDFVAQNLAKAK